MRLYVTAAPSAVVEYGSMELIAWACVCELRSWSLLLLYFSVKNTMNLHAATRALKALHVLLLSVVHL